MHKCTTQRPAHTIDMLHGDIWKKMFLFAIPLAATSILQQLFNSVDVAVVGRFSTRTAQAAVGDCGPVINVLLNLFIGISIGANIVTANALGSEDHERAQCTVHTSMIIGLLSGILLMVLGQIIARPVLTLINTPADTLDQAVLYLKIYFLGMPVILLYNFGAAILRSVGNTRDPLYALIFSGIVNTVLNTYLVVVWHLGAEGVAIATVISNVISCIIVLAALMTADERIRLHVLNTKGIISYKLRISSQEMVDVIKVGLPAGIQACIFSLANIFIQSAINIFGAAAIAGSSITLNFEFYTYFVATAFAQAVVTFMSQNIGAGQKERCGRIYRDAFIWSEIFMIVLGLLFVLGRGFFLGLFTKDPEVIHYAAIRMVMMLSLYWIIPFYEIPGAALRGMGYSALPAWINVFGMCVLRVAWLYTGFRLRTDYFTLLAIYPVNWLVTAVLSMIYYRKCKAKVFVIESRR